MMRLFRPVLLSLMCLTLFATTASAESAWVLWGQRTLEARSGSSSQEWIIVKAFPTEERCSNQWTYAVKEYLWTEREYPGVGKGYWSNFQCLPDTVDPRGPRGGGR